MQSYWKVLSVSGMCLSFAATVAGQSEAPATAQPTVPVTQSVAEPNTITVTPFVSVSFGMSEDWKSSLGVGFAVGYDLTKNLGFEFELGHVFDVAGNDENLDFDLTNISGNIIYHFDMPRLTPYASLGIGWEYASPEVQDPEILALYPPASTEIAWNFGGGIKYPINSRLLARADLRRFQVNDIAPDHWRFYGGITFWVKRN